MRPCSHSSRSRTSTSRGASVAVEQLLRAAGVDLFDRGLRVLQQLAVARHGFRLYSGDCEWPGARRLSSRRELAEPGLLVRHLRGGRRLGRRGGRRARHARATFPAAAKPRSGHPPLSLALGDRADREARELDRAQRLYAAQGLLAGRHDLRPLPLARGTGRDARSPPGRPARSSASKSLQAANRRSALVALHLGLAYYWDRRNDDALAAVARRGERRSPTRPTRSAPTTSSTRSTRPGCRASCPRSSRRSGSAPCRGRSRSRRCAPTPPAAGRTRRSSTAPRCSSSAGRSPPSGQFAAAARLAPERPRRPRRRGGRPLRQGESGARLRQARPAHARLPAGPDRPLPPRPAAALVGAGEGGAQAAPAGAAPGPALAARQAGDAVPRGPRAHWDRLTEIRAVRPMASVRPP